MKLISNLTRMLASGERLPLRPTDPIGVLLISDDPRFRAVVGELLRQRGLTVTNDEQMTAVPRLAGRVRAEVVVLDADASSDTIAAEAVAITRLCSGVGVVVVGASATTTVSGVHALAKWGSIDALCRAIEDARPDHGRVF